MVGRRQTLAAGERRLWHFYIIRLWSREKQEKCQALAKGAGYGSNNRF